MLVNRCPSWNRALFIPSRGASGRGLWGKPGNNRPTEPAPDMFRCSCLLAGTGDHILVTSVLASLIFLASEFQCHLFQPVLEAPAQAAKDRKSWCPTQVRFAHLLDMSPTFFGDSQSELLLHHLPARFALASCQSSFSISCKRCLHKNMVIC